jgi:hypothetical protein
MRSKTVSNDALGIAQMMRIGWYRAVHMKRVKKPTAVHKACQQQAVEPQAGGSGKPHSRRPGAHWSRIESTVRCLGIEVDDALAIAEQVDV